jgi:hypothetical protein
MNFKKGQGFSPVEISVFTGYGPHLGGGQLQRQAVAKKIVPQISSVSQYFDHPLSIYLIVNGTNFPPKTVDNNIRRNIRLVSIGGWGDTKAHVFYTGETGNWTSTRGDVLYAIVLAWPGAEAVVRLLSLDLRLYAGEVAGVELLGSNEKLTWTRDKIRLKVKMPPQRPCDHAFVLKITRNADLGIK